MIYKFTPIMEMVFIVISSDQWESRHLYEDISIQLITEHCSFPNLQIYIEKATIYLFILMEGRLQCCASSLPDSSPRGA